LVLVDTKKQIVFVGHPSKIDLEAKIDELLEGKGEEVEKPEAAPERVAHGAGCDACNK
jgi:hypothetical protein